MKKLTIFVLMVLFIMASAFATNPSSGKVAELSDSASADIKYSITLSSTSIEDAYEVGFSSTPVTTFEPVTSFATDIESMSIKEGDFVGTLNNNVYIYWQIVSKENLTISLSASSMQEDGGLDYVNVSLATTAGDNSGIINNGNAISTTALTEDGQTVSGTVLSIGNDQTSSESAIYKCVGSQKITLTTENVVDIAGGLQNEKSYIGTLTATISIV